MKSPVKTNHLTAPEVLRLNPFTTRTKGSTLIIAPVFPEVKGCASLKKDNHINQSFKVELFDLAQVKEVIKTKSTYLVWRKTYKDSILMGS